MLYDGSGNLVIESPQDFYMLNVINLEQLEKIKDWAIAKPIIFEYGGKLWKTMYDSRYMDENFPLLCEEVEQVEITEKRWVKKQSQV